MMRTNALGLLTAALLVGCVAPADGTGDDAVCEGKCDRPGNSFLDRLNALPGVRATLEQTEGGEKYYKLAFRQPVDHEDPDGPTFEQHATLVHQSVEAPMVVFTTGYYEYQGATHWELTDVLGANQISIEHRYFGASRPETPDWSKLTIKQMADDQHVIIEKLKTLYSGAFISTGHSKGGMTAVYHRRFYPDDVVGTVPYVAPISFGAPDHRYDAYMDTIGPDDCRQAIRDLAVEMLRDRRDAIVASATAEAVEKNLAYTRIPLDAAAELAIVGFEWSFWQYTGKAACDRVPHTDASDEEIWTFLNEFSAPNFNTDDNAALVDAYYYQAEEQLGFNSGGVAYLEPYRHYTDNDYPGLLPDVAKPTYDGGAAMRDIDQWVKKDGSELLFIYGQWDPWSGGTFSLGNATDSAIVIEPEGTHYAGLAGLAPTERAAAFAKLEEWTGVNPTITQRAKRNHIKLPRLPL